MIAHGLLSGVSAVIMPVRECGTCKGSWPAKGSDEDGWRCGYCHTLEPADLQSAVHALRLINGGAPPERSSGPHRITPGEGHAQPTHHAS